MGALYDFGYRWGYRLGALIARYTPAPIVRWYWLGRKRGQKR
jgi:hypothetical protein